MFPVPCTMLSVLYAQYQVDAGLAAPASVPDSRWPARASRPRRSAATLRARWLGSSAESREVSSGPVTLAAGRPRRPAAAGPVR
jgi:hypothetical protein